MTRAPRRLGSVLGSLFVLGCGGSDAGNSLDVGGDEAGTFVPVPGAGGDAFDASVQENGVTVTFVTLTCAAGCADVEAVATGGNPPYSYAWTDGARGATRHLCPTSTTGYSVNVTDSGSSGEFAKAAQTVKATLEANVVACPDGGAEIGTNCDDLAAGFNPAGVNPNRPWSYGWTDTVGAAFTLYPQFIAQELDAGPYSTTGFPSIAQWFDPANGVVSETGAVPDIQYNPLPMPVYPGNGNLSGNSWAVGAGQIVMSSLNVGTKTSVARWTATSGGTYGVKVTFASAANTGFTQTAEVHVQHNGQDLSSGVGAVTAGAPSFSFYASVAVGGGDTIDFVAAPGSGVSYHMVSVAAKVCRGGGDGG
jgi:hypothetical protein